MIVAIAGNAVEHVVGVVLAAKGKSDLAVSVVKNSVAQIAAFLFPALVLLSLFFDDRLTFVASPVYIGALALMAIAVWQVTGDGEATEFEGIALIGALRRPGDARLLRVAAQKAQKAESSRGATCFLRLITPGRSSTPSSAATPNARSTVATSPAASRSVPFSTMSVTISAITT